VRIIARLLQFKQALYREAKFLGLTKVNSQEETSILIRNLGSLSWQDNLIQ